MSSNGDIRLICFDLGRVLVSICRNWQHAAEVARLEKPLPEMSEQQKQSLREIVYASERGRIAQEEFCRQAGVVLGIEPCHVSSMSDIYLTGVYPGVAELLDALHERGHVTACLSNTNENHWKIMFGGEVPAFAPLQKLRHRFASQIIGARKPDPAIYEHVERTLKLEPSQILFFDDLADNIAAARSRGWITQLIADDGDPIAQVRSHLSRLKLL